jgi:hypothetical protein
MAKKTTIQIEDVGGSFKRFLAAAPREARAALYDAVEKTAFSMQQRMRANLSQGPDAPHIKETISYKRRGQRAEIGLLDGQGGEMLAASGSTATQAEVGMYNEYQPNGQPFMRPAAEAENRDFTRRVTDAIKKVERDLSGGGGLL